MATITSNGRQAAEHRNLPLMENLGPDELDILYDRELDTLFVHFFGHERRAINRLAGDYAYVRVDPQTSGVMGLQIERFLRRAVKAHPELIELLRHAELRGVSFERVQRESMDVVPSPRRWLLRLRTGLRLVLPASGEQPARLAMAALRLYSPDDVAAEI